MHAMFLPRRPEQTTRRWAPTRRKQIRIHQLGEMWTSGALHEQSPDYVKRKATARTDRGRFERHVCSHGRAIETLPFAGGYGEVGSAKLVPHFEQ